MSQTDPYAEGCEACHAGRSETDNPYEVGTDGHLSWNDGFASAGDAAAEDGDDEGDEDEA